MTAPIPPDAERAIEAARRLDPHRVPCITFEPQPAGGPAWAMHGFKRWLVPHSKDPAQVLDGLACAFLARGAWLGKGTMTAVPEALRERHKAIRRQLEAVR